MEYLEKHPDADLAQMVTVFFFFAICILMSMIDFPNCQMPGILAFQENNSYGSETRLCNVIEFIFGRQLTNERPNRTIYSSMTRGDLLSAILVVRNF